MEATKTARAEADRLNGVVRALDVDAPNSILKGDRMIPGLSLDGDIVRLDGTSLDELSSAQKLRFSVEIARRANVKARFLLVDGLERISPANMLDFVQLATAGGYQLIATKVADGDVEILALQPAEVAEVK